MHIQTHIISPLINSFSTTTTTTKSIDTIRQFRVSEIAFRTQKEFQVYSVHCTIECV